MKLSAQIVLKPVRWVEEIFINQLRDVPAERKNKFLF